MNHPEIAQDWNGRPIQLASSRGGTRAVVDVNDNLLRTGIEPWPPPEITQKLYAADRQASFNERAWKHVTGSLGHYTDLQSLNSEDALTWSWFGTLAKAAPTQRARTLNWLVETVEAAAQANPDTVPSREDAADNATCDVALWRRVPHPDTRAAGGPEIDAVLVGDKTVVIVEAKWRSPEGRNQGPLRTKTQMQLRREFFDLWGHQLFWGRTRIVLGVCEQGTVEASPPPDTPLIGTRAATWSGLATCPSHPAQEEFGRYLQWKQHLTAAA